MNYNQIQIEEEHYGNSANRPDVNGILIPGKRGRIFSVLYAAAGAGPHPAVLMLHGIPGCERNFDLAQSLRRSGFHVMTFHYSGNWGSDGEYSLANNLDDAETVLDYMLKDETGRFDPRHIYALGHSLGGFVCAQLTARRSEIQGSALLMPCDIGRVCSKEMANTEAGQSIREVFCDSAQWLRGTTGDKLFREAKLHSEEFRFENAADRLAAKPILCITGSLDVYTPAALHCEPMEQAIHAHGGSRFLHEEYPTDHFFCDYRLTVSQRINTFFMQMLKG